MVHPVGIDQALALAAAPEVHAVPFASSSAKPVMVRVSRCSQVFLTSCCRGRWHRRCPAPSTPRPLDRVCRHALPFGAAEWRLGVNDPVGPSERIEPLGERGGIGEMGKPAKKA